MGKSRKQPAKSPIATRATKAQGANPSREAPKKARISTVAGKSAAVARKQRAQSSPASPHVSADAGERPLKEVASHRLYDFAEEEIFDSDGFWSDDDDEGLCVYPGCSNVDMLS
jgi:hypothetical protein